MRGQAVAVSYSCQDPGDRSAVTLCDGPVASGGALDTTLAGTFAFTVKTADALGNTASQTVSYEVNDEIGALASSAASGPTGSSARRGSTVSSPGTHSSPAGSPAAPIRVAPPVRPQPASGSLAGSSPARRSGSAPPGPSGGAHNPAAPVARASDNVVASAVEQALAPYDPRADPAKTIGILVAVFTLLQLGGSTGGLALARGAGGVLRAPRGQRLEWRGPGRTAAGVPAPAQDGLRRG